MNLAGAHVLVTGGTGSFGHAMTQRLLTMSDGPERVAILSRDEVKQAEMRAEFQDDIRLRFFLGDVRDLERLRVATRGVHVIFHAAALKRIEACAYSPEEAVKTNILGSLNVGIAATEARARKVVAISSDKACAPVNAYGASKAMMEHLFTSSASLADQVGHNGTAFSCIRYGNVAGSRGSVIPLWRDHIRNGQLLPVIDPDHTRFWFTLREAVDLAFWAVEHAKGGELVVPNLRGFRLGDLAVAMAGKPYPWRKAQARPGEKDHESLVSKDEAPRFRHYDQHLVRFIEGTERGAVLTPGFELTSRYADRIGLLELKDKLDELGFGWGQTTGGRVDARTA